MLAFAAVCIGDPGAWIMACIVLIIPTIKYIYNQNYEQKEKDYIIMNCPNCGAINDVDRHGKTRCDYYKTIIEHE